MFAQDASQVSSASYSATDLSKRTDHTSYSIPHDGREVTIQPPRSRRRDPDAGSALSQRTNTSLLIEYYEQGDRVSSDRRPSVRVKVTPSAARRLRNSDGESALQISEVGADRRSGRAQPAHVQRISLSPHLGEDRMVLGQDSTRGRTYSGGQSTLSSFASGDDANRGPFNVTVVREAGSPGSWVSSPKEVESLESRRRGRRRGDSGDTYYADDHVKVSKGRRSRSVSYEMADDKALKLTRRRSRSASRERGQMSRREKEMIEQGVREELDRLRNPKARKKSRVRASKVSDDEGLKPPQPQTRSRNTPKDSNLMDDVAREKARARRKAAMLEGSGPSASTAKPDINNPDLIALIQNTIKELLPEIVEMKKAESSSLSRSDSKRPAKVSSAPEVKGAREPMVVLSPDTGHGPGPDLVLSGREKGRDEESDARLGPIHSPLHSEHGEGVSLVGTVPGAERVAMPEAPQRPDTRESIRSAKSGLPDAGVLPYPANAKSSGMPSSGTTPPPKNKNTNRPADRSEAGLPQFTELDLNLRDNSGDAGASTVLSDRTGAAGTKSQITKTILGGPSIATFNEQSELELDDGHVSATSSNTRQPPTTAQPARSELSLRSMTQAASTVLAKDRKTNGRRNPKVVDELSEIHEGDYDQEGGSTEVDPVSAFFAEQRERQQEQALLSQQPISLEVRHMTGVAADDYEERTYDKLATGYEVLPVGANPSMRSTPVAPPSAIASVLDPSALDGISSLSYRPNSRPHLGASAVPVANDPMPAIEHIVEEEDDDEINTNPSVIQGPIQGRPTEWDLNAPEPQPVDDLGITTSRGMPLGPESAAAGLAPGSRPSSRMPTPQKMDEGYMSSANHLGSGGVTPIPGTNRDGAMGGIDDALSDMDFYRGHHRNGLGSGNSHGMPSPIYDGATGRGIDRIQSKDIVALMEHLTVRDAQRNARDTEILVTLVRSAAEMRNSFEDLKKALTEQSRTIIGEVEQNTERSVQKVIQGPRPQPPSAPRRPRYQDDGEEEMRAKKANVFKRALKGLSGRSAGDFERIEEMLNKILGDVEDLKDNQQFYQQSSGQSLATIEKVHHGDQEAVATFSAGNSGYHSAGPSRQPSGKIPEQQMLHPIPPINEDTTLDTPPKNVRGESLPLDTPPHTKVANNASVSLGNTPTKSEKQTKRESGSTIFPKISRWSETTASTGLIRNFLGKGKHHDGSEGSRPHSEFNFWEQDAAAKAAQGDQYRGSYGEESQRTERPISPILPPEMNHADSPINQSHRISLDIQHPRPMMKYNHQLEDRAQQLIAEGGGILNSPQNNSVSSLGTFPPLGPGGFQDGKLMSPLAQEAFLQHQAQTSQKALQKPDAPRDFDAILNDGSSERKKKHRERDEHGNKVKKPKKQRSEEERERRRAERRERKERERDGASESSRKKSRDLLSPDNDGPSMSGRTPSTASRPAGPRPPSSASNKENSRRSHSHRHNGSRGTNDTFGNNDYEYASYR